MCRKCRKCIFILRTDEEIQTVLPRIKETLEYYLKGFGDDGACVEGINYWAYGFGYFTYFAQLLYQYSDGKDNLFDNKKVENIAVFPQKLWFKIIIQSHFPIAEISLRKEAV